VPREADIADSEPANGRARYRDITCWPDMPPVRAHVPRVAPSGSWLAGCPTRGLGRARAAVRVPGSVCPDSGRCAARVFQFSDFSETAAFFRPFGGFGIAGRAYWGARERSSRGKGHK
jgi:hypothetical protein